MNDIARSQSGQTFQQVPAAHQRQNTKGSNNCQLTKATTITLQQVYLVENSLLFDTFTTTDRLPYAVYQIS